jgi:hypothetical protein
MIISQQEVERIISKLDKEDYWFNELGRESHKLKPKRGVKAAYNFTQIGKVKYGWAEKKLYSLFCTHGRPKKNLSMLIEGDQRDIVQAIFTAVFIELDTTIAIATPVTALIIRKGLVGFCKSSYERRKERRPSKATRKKTKKRL